MTQEYYSEAAWKFKAQVDKDYLLSTLFVHMVNRLRSFLNLTGKTTRSFGLTFEGEFGEVILHKAAKEDPEYRELIKSEKQNLDVFEEVWNRLHVNRTVAPQ